MPANEVAREQTQVAAPTPDDKHIVETLIEERAAKLRVSPLWPLYRAILYPLLRQPEAVRMADAIADTMSDAFADAVTTARLDLAAEAIDLAFERLFLIARFAVRTGEVPDVSARPNQGELAPKDETRGR